jgi:hypothetical protein
MILQYLNKKKLPLVIYTILPKTHFSQRDRGGFMTIITKKVSLLPGYAGKITKNPCKMEQFNRASTNRLVIWD